MRKPVLLYSRIQQARILAECIDIIDKNAAADPIENFVLALPELSGCTLLESIVFRNPSPFGILRVDYS